MQGLKWVQERNKTDDFLAYLAWKCGIPPKGGSEPSALDLAQYLCFIVTYWIFQAVILNFGEVCGISFHQKLNIALELVITLVKAERLSFANLNFSCI